MNSAICRSASMRSSSSFFLPSNTRLTSDNANSRPITASICNRSFSSAGSRIDARGEHSLHCGGDFHSIHRLGELHGTVAHQRTVFEQRLHNLFHEEGIALGPFDHEPFEWN